MPTQSSKKYVLIAIALIIIAGAVYFSSRPADTMADWVAYENGVAGLDLKHPAGWITFDNVSPQNSCCIFVLNYQETATTTFEIPGNIKLQIGLYDTSSFDPFKLASTTKMTLGKNTVYAGTNGTPFYIIPRTETTGMGVAVFSTKETQKEAMDVAEKIISTIHVQPITASTSTTTSTP